MEDEDSAQKERLGNLLSIDKFNRSRSLYRRYSTMLQAAAMRTPYLIEDIFGVNMQYWIAWNVPAQ